VDRPSDSDARLQYTEDWYRDFAAADAETVERDLLSLFSGHAPYFRQLSGRVLDVGGGAGLVARYMDPRVHYWVVDPSSVWHEPSLADLSQQFRQSGPIPHFVQGYGEQLPFPDADFDSVLAIFSLNHADDPSRCIAEIGRVLRPGGEAYVVLEDMMPSWGELLRHAAARIAHRFGIEHRVTVGAPELWKAFPAKLLGKWPLSPDHIYIDSDELIRNAQAAMMTLRDRRWVAGYLTLTFRRRS
jgi:SAM-dependent methyltransferase